MGLMNMNKAIKLYFVLLGITSVFWFYIRYAENDKPKWEWTIFPKWFPIWQGVAITTIVYCTVLIGAMIYDIRKMDKKIAEAKKTKTEEKYED